MRKALAFVSDILEILTVISFLVLAVLIFLQIGGRWSGMKNLGWTGEIISCFTTWMVFLGLAYICERDAHIHITMLLDMARGRVKTAMLLVVRAANVACGVAMTYSGYMWTHSTATKITPTLQVSYNIWYSSVWICGAFFTLFAIAKLCETIAAIYSGDGLRIVPR